MKNLTNKLAHGAKQILNDGKKLVLPVVAGTALYASTAQDLNAQSQVSKSPYSKHDKGGKFRGYSSNSQDMIEEKVFYNLETKREERFYIQHLDKDLEKVNQGRLDIAALPFYGTMPIMDFKTGNALYFASDSMYYFSKMNERSLELVGSHVFDRCDDQIRDIAGVKKGQNYISTSFVRDYFKSLSKDMVLELGDGQSFLVVTLPKKEQVKGKTNYLLIPFDDAHQWGVDPITKRLWVFGDLYRGQLTTGSVVVNGKTGLVSKLGEKDGYADVVPVSYKEEVKLPKENGLYIIFGADGNNKFIDFNAGVQKGPLALVVNYGKAKDENVLDIKTEISPQTGRYSVGTKDYTKMNVKGFAFEVHPLHNQKVAPFIGLGMNNWGYNVVSSEKILNSRDEVLKETNTSVRDSKNSFKTYAGLAVGNRTKLRINLGYDTKTKVIGGISVQVPIDKKKK